jgi:pimeloyl-ACP methyl ester carboxylesterase
VRRKGPREPAKYILLSGASLRTWVWDRLVPLLDGPVTTLELPGTSTPEERRAFNLEDAIGTLTARLKASTKDVVLVGHSIGGMLASGIAHKADEHVRHVVYLGSWLPEKGQNHISMMNWPQRAVLRLILKKNKDGVKAPDSALRKEYCNDLDRTSTELVLENACPEPPGLFLQTTSWDPAPPTHVPTTYIRLTNDNAVSQPLQSASIDRLREPKVVELESGHLPMLSQPRALADIINQAAQA